MERTETSHFYLGKINNESRFLKFIEEVYDKEDDHKPLSEFYGSQGQTFCDHDFLEIGYREEESSLEEFFKPYSYSEHWSKNVCDAANQRNLQDATVLVFISKSEIDSPKSVINDDFELIYIGEFEYPI